MVNAQYFDAVLIHAVHGDIGKGRKQKLSGSFLPSGAATVGRLLQGTDGLVQFANSRPPVVRMEVAEITVDVVKVRGRGGRPADTPLGAEHPLQASVHFFFVDEVAPVGLRNALADRSAKTRIFLKQAQGGVLHQPLRAGA